MPEEPVVNAFLITSDLIKPVTTSINSGLGVMVPIGLGIMGTMIGISLIRRVIYTFLENLNERSTIYGNHH